MVPRKMIKKKSALIKTLFFIITFLLIWCMHIQNHDITPATYQNYMTSYHQQTLTPLTADIILLMCKAFIKLTLQEWPRS